MTSDLPSDLGKGFDTELGLTYLELGPDGGRVQLAVTDKLLHCAGSRVTAEYNWPLNSARNSP